MNRSLRLALVVALVVFIGPATLLAQGGDPPCWPPPCIPIDGGLTTLLAAGAVLGGRQLLSRKRSA